MRSVRKTPPLQPFINAKHDPFTKTGSGQTQEKFEKREMIKRVFFCRRLHTLADIVLLFIAWDDSIPDDGPHVGHLRRYLHLISHRF